MVKHTYEEQTVDGHDVIKLVWIIWFGVVMLYPLFYEGRKSGDKEV